MWSNCEDHENDIQSLDARPQSNLAQSKRSRRKENRPFGRPRPAAV